MSMAVSIYLATTAGEMDACSPLFYPCAWMGCYFSPTDTGLANIPARLPAESLLTVNDRYPIRDHDPKRIVSQLCQAVSRLQPRGVILDLQRPASPVSQALVREICRKLDRPTGVTPPYLGCGESAVFLPPIPPDRLPEEQLMPYRGRQIWLELCFCPKSLTLTPEGCSVRQEPLTLPRRVFYDPRLYCHYQHRVQGKQAEFLLYRTWEDTRRLLEFTEKLGVTRAVGLYQQLVLFSRGPA